jgi:hypothetical protein
MSSRDEPSDDQTNNANDHGNDGGHTRSSPRPPDRCRILPWKISVKGGACAIAVGDAPVGAPLTVIPARRQDARRGRTARTTPSMPACPRG